MVNYREWNGMWDKVKVKVKREGYLMRFHRLQAEDIGCIRVEIIKSQKKSLV